jgi:hypothetical protein
MMASSAATASVDDICHYLRRKCKLPQSAVANATEVLNKYFERKKDFDLIVKNGKVLVLAKKTPTPTPEV